MTEQNENEFVTPGWVIWDRIEAQLETLFKSYTFKYVKIGMVEHAKNLGRIVDFIREKSPDAFILWDPVASASAGYRFLRNMDQDDFVPIMKRLDLITPNQDEFALFGFGLSASRDEITLGKDFALLQKGGIPRGTMRWIPYGPPKDSSSLPHPVSRGSISTAQAVTFRRQSLPMLLWAKVYPRLVRRLKTI
jgi:hydroxymethylpyrimidine/phosphomethylpyrimidine kinase